MDYMKRRGEGKEDYGGKRKGEKKKMRKLMKR